MKPESGPTALVSVLMPCCGMLEYTRLSVPRVLRHSRPPFEVIFIDAASLDGTADYLAGVAAAAPVRVEVVRGERESDFAELVEEAVRRARGAFVAWLNNDVLVPELWLQQLVALASANESIGVVGPMSNLAPEPQRVANLPYRLRKPSEVREAESGKAELDTTAVDHFAREFRDTNKGQWGEVDRVAGFCWLGRMDVIGRVGVIEKGREGILDAGRFSKQVHQAGYRLACCRDMFVHHYGSNLMPEATTR